MKTYASLPVQVADRIQQNINDGVWVDNLPGERALAHQLRVSRKTIRKALSNLNKSGIIESKHGLPHKILKSQKTSKSAGTVTEIGLLTSIPIDQLRPFTVLWIDALRSIATDHEFKLRLYPTTRLFSDHPENAIDRLVHQNPKVFWILTHSHPPLQNWFFQNKTRCIVVGSAHKDINLPSVDLDYEAICRHAAGAMLRAGHRKLAMITKSSQRAGDLDSEKGFLEGSQMQGYKNVSAKIIHHDGSVKAIKRSVIKLMRQKNHPTAIVVVNPYSYLTVSSFLNERGYNVPNDISLICRDNDPFLKYLSPEPYRYICDPAKFASKIFQAVLRISQGDPLSNECIQVEVSTESGTSLANI